MKDIVIQELIEQKIYLVRDQKVMLDKDLAILYGVPIGALNQAVKRNKKRFPEDFAFRLTKEENNRLRSQIVILTEGNGTLKSQFVISKDGRGGRRSMPYAFTEQGVAMLSSVLNSDRAIAVNIQIIRTFIKLRKLLATHRDLLKKIEAMERGYDRQFRIVFEILKELREAPKKSFDEARDKEIKKIGFRPK